MMPSTAALSIAHLLLVVHSPDDHVVTGRPRLLLNWWL